MLYGRAGGEQEARRGRGGGEQGARRNRGGDEEGFGSESLIRILGLLCEYMGSLNEDTEAGDWENLGCCLSPGAISFQIQYEKQVLFPSPFPLLLPTFSLSPSPFVC